MRIILLILASVVSMNAQATTKIETIKTWDGAAATCNSPRDVVRGRNGLYSVVAKDLFIDDAQNVIARIELGFYTCVEKDGKFELVGRNPYSEFRYRGNVGTPTQVELRAYKEGVYKIFAHQAIPDTDENTFVVQLAFPLSEVVNSEEGSEPSLITGDFELYLFQRLEWVLLSGAEFTKANSSGRFRVNFEI